MLRIAIITREWPPDIYGGAGVHVEELVRELRHRADVSVHCFGAHRIDATAHGIPAGYDHANPALQTLAVDLDIVRALERAPVDIAHSHTWYANLAGHIAGRLLGIPHVLTAHSLEPARPWKEEQLGGGYRVSSWAERAAYAEAEAIIAVSDHMRGDILATYPDVDPERVHTVRNGIDTAALVHDPDTSLIAARGIDLATPYILFVGRITRQKGLTHLLRAAADLDPRCQLVLCAAAPDTPEIGAQTGALIAELKAKRGNVFWFEEHLDRATLQQMYSHALAFICPSVYEPLGIVNLEAMACETAVIASDVGGIPEVVLDGVTGLLVHYDATDTARFEVELVSAVNSLVAEPERAVALGKAGRERAQRDFSWSAVADQTMAVYDLAASR